MNTAMQLRLEELMENPSPRLPICLVLDTSGSMAGAKIAELNAAIAYFYNEIRQDEMASITAEIATISFGMSVQKIRDFSGIERQQVPILSAGGMTPMGEAVTLALDTLEQAKRVYKQMGTEYFQPWLVLMTDGEPTDSISLAVQQCRELIQRKKLTVFPIAIGKDANLSILSQFSQTVSALRMEATDLKKFFRFLAMSTSSVSMSNAGDQATSSIGEANFKKFSVDWETAFKK